MGKNLAETARRETAPANLEQATPVPALQAAAVHFHHARGLLDALPMVPLRYLPVVGRQIESARALAGAGAQAADATAQGLSAAHQLLGSRPGSGPARLIQLRQAIAIATTIDHKLKGLHYGPRVGLLSQLATARNELTRDVTQVVTSLDKTLAAGNSLVDLLSGEKRVLLLATNNAEMRAGSGIVLELGVLQVSDGLFHLGTIQSVDSYPVPAGAVTPPPALAARWGWLHPADDWVELLASPCFDQTAPTAAQMWVAAGQAPVDAVMAVDPVFLAGVVSVTGPVTVGAQTYTGNQIAAQVLNGQYLQNTAATSAERSARQDLLGRLASATFTQIDAGGWSLASMVQALASAAEGRHVMLWSKAAADESGWVRSGAGGVLTSQSVEVSILNRGRNKLDWYLATAANLDVAPDGRNTKVTVTVKLSDTTPPGLKGEIVGDDSGNFLSLYPGQKLNYGDYVGVVALSAPQTAASVGIDGVSEPPINGPDGPTYVVGAQYIVADHATTPVTFSFTMAGRHGTITVEPAGRYPAMTWTSAYGTWTGDHPKVIAW